MHGDKPVEGKVSEDGRKGKIIPESFVDQEQLEWRSCYEDRTGALKQGKREINKDKIIEANFRLEWINWWTDNQQYQCRKLEQPFGGKSKELGGRVSHFETRY